MPDLAGLSITRQNRWIYFVLTTAYIVILYMSSNHLSFYHARHLPLTLIDVRTPFWPWTGWIYVMVYFFPLVPAFMADQGEEIKRVLFSFVVMTTLCTLVFIFYPTAYPRPPMPPGASWTFPLSLVRSLDTAKNCFPSQHVAFAFLSAFYIKRYRRHWGTLAILLAILISISTLTTKQHYVWDVLTGYFLARIMYWFSSGGQWLPRTIGRSE